MSEVHAPHGPVCGIKYSFAKAIAFTIEFATNCICIPLKVNVYIFSMFCLISTGRTNFPQTGTKTRFDYSISTP